MLLLRLLARLHGIALTSTPVGACTVLSAAALPGGSTGHAKLEREGEKFSGEERYDGPLANADDLTPTRRSELRLGLLMLLTPSSLRGVGSRGFETCRKVWLGGWIAFHADGGGGAKRMALRRLVELEAGGVRAVELAGDGETGAMLARLVRELVRLWGWEVLRRCGLEGGELSERLRLEREVRRERAEWLR